MADGKHMCESQAVNIRIKRHDLEHAKCEKGRWFITGVKKQGQLMEVCTLCGDVLKTYGLSGSYKIDLFGGNDEDD
jgi:hypothetical protein